MKSIKLIAIIMSVFVAVSTNAQNADIEMIKTVISEFSKAGDTNDAKKLVEYLDDNYRIVMNQMFGSKVVTIMPKEVYVKKIAAKEFGGDQRTLDFETVTVNGNTAIAIVTLKGKKMTVKSTFTLVKQSDEQWKLIGDMPVVV